jgi:hypothetical protein
MDKAEAAIRAFRKAVSKPAVPFPGTGDWGSFLLPVLFRAIREGGPVVAATYRNTGKRTVEVFPDGKVVWGEEVPLKDLLKGQERPRWEWYDEP